MQIDAGAGGGVAESVDETGISPALTARRLRLQSASSLGLREVADGELAALAVDPGRHDAREEVVRRLRPILEKTAHFYCQRLAHEGRTEPCGWTAFEHLLIDRWAFQSALRAGTYRTVGRFADFLPDSMVVHDQAGRRGAPTTALDRFLKSPKQVPLHAYVYRDLVPRSGVSHGVLTDVRRRWNADRGLPQRAQLSALQGREVAAWLSQRDDASRRGLDDLAAAAREPDGFTVAVLQRWADALYNDATENSSSQGLDVARVQRALLRGVADDDARLAVAVGRMALAVSAVIDVVLPLFADRYSAAYALTRPVDGGGADE